MFEIARPCNKLVYISRMKYRIFARWTSKCITVYYQCRRYTTIYYLLSFIIVAKKRQLLPFIFAAFLKSHKQQGADIINRYRGGICISGLHFDYRDIRPWLSVRYRAIAPANGVSGSVNYTLYVEGIATAGSCRNPENRVAGSNALGFRPDQAYNQRLATRREFQPGPDCWPAGREPLSLAAAVSFVGSLAPSNDRDALRSFIIGAQIIIRK